MHPLVLSISILTLCYTIYYFLFYKQAAWQRWLGTDESGYGKVCLMRMAGFLIFLIPYLLTSDAIPTPKNHLSRIQLIAALSAAACLIILLNYFAARSPENLARYPQIRLKKWNASDIVVSSITWILYLVGYEYLFRGYLFFTSLQYFDAVSATGLNSALYMLVHIHKGYKETFGSIPMGFVLCGITYFSGSVWPAIVLHSMLALSNEWFSIFYLSRQNKQL